MNMMFFIADMLLPEPYSYIFPLVAERLKEQHPGAEGFKGSEMLIEYAMILAEEKELIPEEVAIVVSGLFACDDIITGTTCTKECYNITIVAISESESSELHQISYHFSEGGWKPLEDIGNTIWKCFQALVHFLKLIIVIM